MGVPDANSGEAITFLVVKKDPNLTEGDVTRFCAKHVTGYGYTKPKYIEFRTDLPKNNVGKILRRQLRDSGTKMSV